MKLKAWVIGYMWEHSTRPYYSISTVDSESPDCIYRAQIEVEHHLPADWNPVETQIRSIEAAKAQAAEAFQRQVVKLNHRLSKLQALTNEVQG